MSRQPAGAPPRGCEDDRTFLEAVAESRVRSLVDLNRSIVAELSLAAVLSRVVDAARTIGSHFSSGI